MTSNGKRPFVRMLIVIASCIGSMIMAPSPAQASPPRQSSVLGAFSEVHYDTVDSDWVFNVFVSDTIRDHHRCAYVQLELWYRADVTANVWTGAIDKKRVTVCDIDKWETVNINTMDSLKVFWRRMIAGETKIMVKTCEDMGWKRDRCTSWSTKPLDF